MAKVFTGQSTISVFYRLELDDGQRYIIQVTGIETITGQEVLLTYNENYTMVSLLFPQSSPWPFLRNSSPSPAYVMQKLGISLGHAELIAHIMPELSSIAPADQILDKANGFVLNL